MQAGHPPPLPARWQYKIVKLTMGKFGWIKPGGEPAKPGSFFARVEAWADTMDRKLDEASPVDFPEDDYKSPEEAFAILGADGWELVSVFTIFATVVAVFKRPIAA
jgi:hypothetical protein